MAIGYGNRHKQAILLNSQVGFKKVEPKKESHASFTGLRWFFNIAEIGLGLLAPLTGGSTLLIEAALGIANTAAQASIDVAEQGHVNYLDLGINLGGTAFGGVFGGVSNFRNVNKLMGSGLSGVTHATEISKNVFKNTTNTFTKMAGEKMTNLNKIFGGVKSLQKGISKLPEAGGFLKNAGLLNKDFAKRVVKEASKRATFKIANEAAQDIATQADRQFFLKMVSKLGLTVEETKELFKILERTGQKAIGSGNIFESNIEIIEFFRRIDKTGRRRLEDLMVSFEKGLEEVTNFTKSVGKELEDYMQYSMFLASVRKSTKTYSKLSSVRLDVLRKILSKEEFATYKQIEKMETKSLNDKVRLAFTKYHPASAKFNDSVVQRVQAIFDPKDLGRMPVEMAYKALKKKLRSIFKKSIRFGEKLKKLEEAWEKSGGVVLDSDVIIGYKVISIVGTQTLIMIKFRPEATNNKHSVVVWATKKNLLDLQTRSPFKTYLRLWAVAKNGPGGKKVSLFNGLTGSGLDISKKFLFVLKGAAGVLHVPKAMSFLKPQAMRNVLSIVSNIVENGSSMAKGTYTSTYWSNMKKSFINTGITRSFRLLTRGVIGEAASSKISNNILSAALNKELQRAGSVLSEGIKSSYKGKGFNISKTKILRKYQAGALSHTRRTSNKFNKGNLASYKHSLSRKIKVYTRIPNAVVAGRPINLNKWKIK